MKKTFEEIFDIIENLPPDEYDRIVMSDDMSSQEKFLQSHGWELQEYCDEFARRMLDAEF